MNCVSIIFLNGGENSKNMVRVQVKSSVLDIISIMMFVGDSVVMQNEYYSQEFKTKRSELKIHI